MNLDPLRAWWRRLISRVRIFCGFPGLPKRRIITGHLCFRERMRRDMLNLQSEGYWIGLGTCDHCGHRSYVAQYPHYAGINGECSVCRRVTNRPGSATPVDPTQPLDPV